MVVPNTTPTTEVAQHKWVEYRRREVTPIGSMQDGTPAVASLDDEHVAVFCEVCSIGLTQDRVGEPCPGPSDDEEES